MYTSVFFCIVFSTVLAEMGRLQAQLGPGKVWRSGQAVRAFRTHLASRHRTFQQVSALCSLDLLRVLLLQTNHRRLSLRSLSALFNLLHLFCSGFYLVIPG